MRTLYFTQTFLATVLAIFASFGTPHYWVLILTILVGGICLGVYAHFAGFPSSWPMRLNGNHESFGTTVHLTSQLVWFIAVGLGITEMFTGPTLWTTVHFAGATVILPVALSVTGKHNAKSRVSG